MPATGSSRATAASSTTATTTRSADLGVTLGNPVRQPGLPETDVKILTGFIEPRPSRASAAGRPSCRRWRASERLHQPRPAYDRRSEATWGITEATPSGGDARSRCAPSRLPAERHAPHRREITGVRRGYLAAHAAGCIRQGMRDGPVDGLTSLSRRTAATRWTRSLPVGEGHERRPPDRARAVRSSPPPCEDGLPDPGCMPSFCARQARRRPYSIRSAARLRRAGPVASSGADPASRMCTLQR